MKDADASAEDKKAFLKELIGRRELAINFFRYNPTYDRFDACEPWADRTLRQYLRDPRKQVYSETELEQAETHDPLWNAAQKPMMLTGWMHGYLRMYWAKKILEWSPSLAQAFDIAVRLNDRYELDGRDPMGMPGLPGRSSANMTAPGVPSVRSTARFAYVPRKHFSQVRCESLYKARNRSRTGPSLSFTLRPPSTLGRKFRKHSRLRRCRSENSLEHRLTILENLPQIRRDEKILHEPAATHGVIDALDD